MPGKVIRIRGRTFEMLKQRLRRDELLSKAATPDVAVWRALVRCPTCPRAAECSNPDVVTECTEGEWGEF